MKRLKTFAKYILVITLFFIFSRIMIFIGLNSIYGNIELKGNCPQGVSITSSRATSVNGEVKGNILEELNSKYIKFNFYSDLDTFMGSYYITPSELKNGNFEFYYKLNYIDSYSIEVVDEMPEQGSLEIFSSKEFKNYAILSAIIMLMFI